MTIENDDIHKLLVQLMHGDTNAIVMLYGLLNKPLYDLGRAKGLSHEDAEDIVEDTFNHIYSHAIYSYVVGIGGGKAWIKQIFKRRVTDWQRKLSTRQKRETSLDEHQEVFLDDPIFDKYISLTEVWNPEQTVLDKEQSEILFRVWQELSEEDKIEIAVKGRGRGTGRKPFWEAAARAHVLYEKYSVHIKDS